VMCVKCVCDKPIMLVCVFPCNINHSGGEVLVTSWPEMG
jgi:hypothetical protein